MIFVSEKPVAPNIANRTISHRHERTSGRADEPLLRWRHGLGGQAGSATGRRFWCLFTVTFVTGLGVLIADSWIEDHKSDQARSCPVTARLSGTRRLCAQVGEQRYRPTRDLLIEADMITRAKRRGGAVHRVLHPLISQLPSGGSRLDRNSRAGHSVAWSAATPAPT
jgi:hypothetical protein